MLKSTLFLFLSVGVEEEEGRTGEEGVEVVGRVMENEEVVVLLVFELIVVVSSSIKVI